MSAILIEDKMIPGIFPMSCGDMKSTMFEHELDIKDYLEERSGYKFDLESIRYMIETSRTRATPEDTIFGYCVRTGLIWRLGVRDNGK
jgi:hypothetical protein